MAAVPATSNHPDKTKASAIVGGGACIGHRNTQMGSQGESQKRGACEEQQGEEDVRQQP